MSLTFSRRWKLLAVLDDIAERTHNNRYKIHILALRAQALDAQGKTSEADATLQQAVDRARSGGFLRVFLDLGRPMQEMLRRLSKQESSAQSTRGILAAFNQEDRRSGAAQPGHPREASPLAEPLTTRELEVLSLLRGPQSVKEIALQLHISPATAKRHIANIYGKLDVKQRWQAVARAEELHILPPR